MGLGSVLGSLGAGLLIGPVLDLVGHEAEDLRHFGEFGIAVMLFLVGLEVLLGKLWELPHRLLELGGAQVLRSATGIALVAGRWLGQPWSAILAVGLALVLSLTSIVVQTLAEKRLLDTPGGMSSFAVL